MNVLNLFCMSLALLFDGSSVWGFNINTDDSRTFYGTKGSLFGFSVLGHHASGANFILVGTPNGTADCQRGKLSEPPGALFQCSLPPSEGQDCASVCLDDKGNQIYEVSGTTVVERKERQFLGVSLTSQPGPNGKVVVCGHKWINFYSNTYYDANGVCYSIKFNSRREVHSKEIIRPCFGGSGRYSWDCLGGASAHFAVDGKTLMLGAPGALNTRGSVVTINGTQKTFISSLWGYYITYHQFPYVGYSLTSGRFSGLSAVEGVTGAPRYKELGRVYIFDLHQNSVVQELSGEPANTYFGASVEAVDLNNDGWSDLLVGAPLYSIRQDEGCVYVYVNNKMGELDLQIKIKRPNAIGARFGSAIKNAGDLNKDGYADVAIGAPFEDNGSGAVYIYHGASYGLNSKYSQRIPGKKFGLTSFGSSLSGALDLDGNDYPDLIVGAHQSDAVVYLRARPVVSMEASLDISPSTLNIRNASAVNTNKIKCTVTVCLMYTGVGVSQTRALYTLRADSQMSSILPSRVYFEPSQSMSTIEKEISLQLRIRQCKEHALIVKNNAKDFLNPIPVQLLYRLGNDSAPLAPVINPAALSVINKEIGFARNCGDDEICVADLDIEHYSYSLLSGQDAIYLGADSVVYVNVEVFNAGEEAHQARLSIRHPENVVYEAVETVMSTDEAFIVKCEPVSVDDISLPYIVCGVGNPLRNGAKVSLQVRLDIGSLAPSQTELNISLSMSTSSNELDPGATEALINVPIIILADVTMKGASTPDQVVYKQDSDYNSVEYLTGILDAVKQLSIGIGDMVVSAEDRPRGTGGEEGRVGQEDASIINTNIGATPAAPGDTQTVGGAKTNSSMGPSVNSDTMIGPNFVQHFEVANLGPGRIPYRSFVNISIPWRMQDGDWLIFITQVQGKDGVETCNTGVVLKQQYENISRHYSEPSKNEAQDDNMKKGDSKKSGPLRTAFDCVTAQCVTLQCQIQPLALAASAVIEVHARLWKHSFLKGNYGLVTMTSNMSVQVKNPLGLFSQPDEHSPDSGTVKVTVSAEEIQAVELPLPGWVIPVSTCSGILLLVIMVASMAKLGFFRRKKMEEMKRRLVQETEQREEQLKDENSQNAHEADHAK